MENKLEKIGQNSFMDNFIKTDDILKDMCGIIESSQKAAYRAVNTTLIQRNWLLGYRIASEELQGEDRAKYGAEIIKKLAKELSAEYGKGYTKSNLYSFYSFYKTYPEIFQTPSGKSVGLLSWSHYAALLQVKDKAARNWYEKEATEQTWSVRTLQRNISSQYYYRMLKTQKRELVESEMKELTAPYQNDKLEFIKNPVVAEFLGFSQNADFTESDLEKSILSNLQKFLMELGKGYAFVAMIGKSILHYMFLLPSNSPFLWTLNLLISSFIFDWKQCSFYSSNITSHISPISQWNTLQILIRTSRDTVSFLFNFVATDDEISAARIKSCLFI